MLSEKPVDAGVRLAKTAHGRQNSSLTASLPQATVVIAITGIRALVYASGQLKESREAERVKHLLTFVREFDTEPMVNWRKSVAEKYLKGDDPFPDAERLLDFFETIGLLVRRDYLDANDVWNMFGIWMFGVYATFRDDIEQMQKDDATYYEDFCNLLTRLTAIERDRGQNADRPSRRPHRILGG